MAPNTVTTLNGLFKEVYADKLVDLVPDGVVFCKDVPFAQPSKRIGNKYHQPVVLTAEHGFTYSAAAQGAFSLNAAVPAQHDDAEVIGGQIVLESAVDYESLARSSNDKSAFEQAMGPIMRNMMKSFGKRVELAHLYGGISLGTLASDPGTGTTSYTLTVSDETWSAGIWSGMEGATIDVYSNSSGAPGTIRNTAAVTIASVSVANKTLSVTCTSAELDNATTGDHIVFRGAKAAEWTGLTKIARNTGSLFSVDAATYSLWAGNTFDADGQLTMPKVLASLRPAVARGLDESVCAYVSTGSWTDLMEDLAALRRFDGSYSKKGKNGFESIEFYSINGAIEVVPHRMMKDGEALIFPKAKCKRLGAQDITFELPGKGGEFFFHSSSTAAAHMRGYTMQATFCEQPAGLVSISGIENSDG